MGANPKPIESASLQARAKIPLFLEFYHVFLAPIFILAGPVVIITFIMIKIGSEPQLFLAVIALPCLNWMLDYIYSAHQFFTDLKGFEIRFTSGELKVTAKGSRQITIHLKDVEYVAVVALRRPPIQPAPRFIMIQLNTTTAGASDWDRYFVNRQTNTRRWHYGSDRTLLIPDQFTQRISARIGSWCEGAGLRLHNPVRGCPDGLRVIRAWSRTPGDGLLCKEDLVAFTPLRKIRGACPVCRVSPPHHSWFFRTQFSCRHCKSALKTTPSALFLLPSLLLGLGVGVLVHRAAPQPLAQYHNWAAIIAFFGIAVRFSRRASLYSAVSRRGILCPGCGYDLRASQGPDCPECGVSMDPLADLKAADRDFG